MYMLGYSNIYTCNTQMYMLKCVNVYTDVDQCKHAYVTRSYIGIIY